MVVWSLLNVTGGVGGRKEERRESWKIRRCGLVPPAAAQDANLVALGRMRELGRIVAKNSCVPQLRGDSKEFL
jgi:hypothetical protein